MSSRADVLKAFDDKKHIMDDRINSGIEANRKGFASLTFVDEKNEAISGVEVKITQKTHDFKYGANLFMLDEIPDKEKNEQYKKYFADAFNIATLPFYWSDLEPEPGKVRYSKNSPKIYRRPAPDLCLEYCDAHGIEPKMHCLNFNTFTPQWAKGDAGYEKRCLVKHFRELAERYADKIPMWEVTNEMFWNSYYNKYHNTSLYRSPDIVEWSFALAENCFPGNKLIINEAHSRIWNDEWFYDTRSPYYMQIERAMLKGARIDSIGMQYHMFYKRENESKETAIYYDPEQLYKVMDTYALLGKPLQITEITIPSYSNSKEDEAIQAKIIENLYRIWFSHPAMEAIIYWNQTDGYGYNAEPGDMSAGENVFYGGLIRFDFSVKPSYQVIKDLFSKEWRTNLQLHSENGKVDFKGFYGKYDLEIIAKGEKFCRTIHLNKEKQNNYTIKL